MLVEFVRVCATISHQSLIDEGSIVKYSLFSWLNRTWLTPPEVLSNPKVVSWSRRTLDQSSKSIDGPLLNQLERPSPSETTTAEQAFYTPWWLWLNQTRPDERSLLLPFSVPTGMLHQFEKPERKEKNHSAARLRNAHKIPKPWTENQSPKHIPQKCRPTT